MVDETFQTPCVCKGKIKYVGGLELLGGQGEVEHVNS